MLSYYITLAKHSLTRNPVLTTLMVLTIAVGIGASMTTLTVMHVLSRDPLPGKSASIYYPQLDPSPTGSAAHRVPLRMMDYRSGLDLWSAHRAYRQALIADSPVKVSAPGVDRPTEMVTLLSTTSDFFPMFNVPFEYGSAWTADDGANRGRVAVISSDLNNKLFGGKDSVGETLRLSGSDMRIVGVLKPWHPSPRFYSIVGGMLGNGQLNPAYGSPEDVFVPFFTGLDINAGAFQPFVCWGAAPKIPGHLVNAPCAWVALWVELHSTQKVADYRAFVANYAQHQKALGRFKYADTRMLNLMQWLDYIHVVPSNVKLQIWLAFAFLTVCLFNTVGLLLAKFLRRSGEVGVRRALGASRGSIFAQHLIEAGLIGFIGGAGGWLLTLAGLWLVRYQSTTYSELVHMDISMFFVTFGLAIAVSLLAGMLPALRASRISPALQLKTY